MEYTSPINKVSSKKKWRIRVFVLVMLAYPVIHFSVFWLFVNFNAIRLSMMGTDWFGDETFVGFRNYINVFNDIRSSEITQNVMLNSFLFFPVTVLITLPLSLLFSYFLFKKMPAANIFRVIFFLPSIMPVVALTFAFRSVFSYEVGPASNALAVLGIPGYRWLGVAPWTQIIVFMYCVWAGLGFNIVLFSGAMGRVPYEIVESAKLDGINMRKEFTHIMIPLIWPTVVTLVILAMTSVLTVFLQPMLLLEGGLQQNAAAGTISLLIFTAVRGGGDLSDMAAFGLMMSLIFAPIIMLARFLLSKIWAGVEY